MDLFRDLKLLYPVAYFTINYPVLLEFRD
jgi:hypothetical protein